MSVPAVRLVVHRFRLALALSVVALLAGCAAPAPATGEGPSAGPAITTSTTTTTITVSVDQGRVSPPPRRVELPRGQQVRLTVHSSEPTDIHVHGYDLEGQARPGQPAVFAFTVDRAGRFDVEAHPETLLLQLVVR
ncbi:hypothetical protein [Actinopolymorpha alba]|uniref:hypothetical protein n=1 Tax=Actinopolymorpha alba TaxID=533267 RepID=UPI00037D0F3F|nr:hypothetical protein [Actinopolymorpha alba]